MMELNLISLHWTSPWSEFSSSLDFLIFFLMFFFLIVKSFFLGPPMDLPLLYNFRIDSRLRSPTYWTFCQKQYSILIFVFDTILGDYIY